MPEVTFGTVSRLESAKRAPAWATVMQVIDALGVSLIELARSRKGTPGPLREACRSLGAKVAAAVCKKRARSK